MRYVVFENPGEIDPRMISTFGVNVKEGAHPFGVFGTGLKFAVAILLRTGHHVTVYSGLRVFRLGTTPVTLREKAFDFVTLQQIDGFLDGDVEIKDAWGNDIVRPGPVVELGFTTEVGKNWDVWMAFRELYCNAKDEGGAVNLWSQPEPEAGLTKIVVDGDGIRQAYETRQEFVLEGDGSDILATVKVPGWPGAEVEIRTGESTGWFYRSIRVSKHEKDLKGAFTYNILSEVDLTEDRTAKYPWLFLTWLADIYLNLDKAPVIRAAMLAGDGYVEHELDFESKTPTKVFSDVVGGLREHYRSSNSAPRDELPKGAWNLHEEFTRKGVEETTLVPTPVQNEAVARALAFCRRIDSAPSKPVVLTDLLGSNVESTMKNDTLYINVELTADGADWKPIARLLIAARMREGIGRGYGADDTMRKNLMDKVMELGERLSEPDPSSGSDEPFTELPAPLAFEALEEESR